MHFLPLELIISCQDFWLDGVQSTTLHPVRASSLARRRVLDRHTLGVTELVVADLRRLRGVAVRPEDVTMVAARAPVRSAEGDSGRLRQLSHLLDCGG